MKPLEPFENGLRCQDVHAGLRGVDPNSAPLARLEDTRLVGMAASLATAIRGQDVVSDAQTLKLVAADQLDVDSLAFTQVVDLLAEAGLVSQVKRSSGKVRSFVENVPFHEDLYDRLGRIWMDRTPTQVEEQLIATVHRLAASPVPADELVKVIGLEPSDSELVLGIASESDLVKSVALPDGEVLYSPFMGFENPADLAKVMSEHGSDRFEDEFDTVRRYQGLPIATDTHPVLSDALARGLVLAPSVRRPDGIDQAFASVPYLLDRELFTVKRAILDKALAIVACVRCGQHFGGATAILSPRAILNKLLDSSRGHALTAHSSSKRQYQLLFRMQVMAFEWDGKWVKPRLIPTDDNLAAVKLARDLVSVGEPLENRMGDDADAKALLMSDSLYLSPLQTVHRRRRTVRLNDREYEGIFDTLMGRTPL